MTDLIECDICGKRGVERYSDSSCPNCGQRYEYSYDGVFLSHTKEQLQLLRRAYQDGKSNQTKKTNPPNKT